MAISKKTGRKYQSRLERGYRRVKFPKGFDRWGQPATCGVIDQPGGEECPKPVIPGLVRCDYHEEIHEASQWGTPAPGPSMGREST